MALPPFILDKIVGSRSIGRMCNIPIKKGLLRGKKKEKKNKIGPLILLSGKEKEKKMEENPSVTIVELLIYEREL
jgi:hypothetical protein